MEKAKSCCGEQAVASFRTDGLSDSAAMASVFAALANPARIDILMHIAKHRYCGCKQLTDTLPLAQSTISQHLKVLCDAGLIQVETVHPRSRYFINEDLLADLSDATGSFLKSCCQPQDDVIHC
ncbi:ArsR/SmtB family transcription factor [Pseudahrensia aquimaris]|uniref:ArsR/SmtB family transcription factor n=1 Tax=Pseudahrensia aquimaris TaxID=744461 RepID=A0ABW3FFK4_9HYPH